MSAGEEPAGAGVEPWIIAYRSSPTFSTSLCFSFIYKDASEERQRIFAVQRDVEMDYKRGGGASRSVRGAVAHRLQYVPTSLCFSFIYRDAFEERQRIFAVQRDVEMDYERGAAGGGANRSSTRASASQDGSSPTYLRVSIVGKIPRNLPTTMC